MAVEMSGVSVYMCQQPNAVPCLAIVLECRAIASSPLLQLMKQLNIDHWSETEVPAGRKLHV